MYRALAMDEVGRETQGTRPKARLEPRPPVCSRSPRAGVPDAQCVPWLGVLGGQ